jgi:hypothetical protein
MKRIFILAAAILIIQMAGLELSAQGTREIRGIVTSFKSVPLNNVKVYAVNSNKIQFTDSLGMFTIMCADKDELIINASGFREKQIKTGKKTLCQVDLRYIFNDESFDRAVQNKHIRPDVLQKQISVATLKTEKDYSSYKSIYELIDAEVYEVRVDGSSVYNNKVKSMNSNPLVLYVVDDKIVTDISYITPSYVKSIDFIEDANTTMYGSKGANGVLKIYLK